MNNRMLLAALAGGIAYFLLGYVFYMVLFADFFKANAGSAAGFNREEPVMWAVAAASLVMGFLYAWIFDRWASINTARGGLMGGATLGFLIALSVDLLMYGTTNGGTLTAALVDPLISAVMGGLMGGVVGWVLGYRQTSVRAQGA